MLAVSVVVDTRENDPVDVRCGGPQYLGFDFTVQADQANAIAVRVRTELDTARVKYIRVHTTQEFETQDRCWDLCEIIEEIRSAKARRAI